VVKKKLPASLKSWQQAYAEELDKQYQSGIIAGMGLAKECEMQGLPFYTLDNAPEDLDLLGGKGYGLVRMHRAGFRVPPAIIIPVTACKLYMQDPDAVVSLLNELLPQIINTMQGVGDVMPLVSVRSGAKFSMPGMMDTILNVGIDETNASHWRASLGQSCADEVRGKLVEMFGSVVFGIERHKFQNLGLRERFKLFEKETGQKFPKAKGQLIQSICAVFASWGNERAKVYRDMNGIPHDLGTAVVIQQMVFGNLDVNSCTVVAFSRDPSTGENKVVGEFLPMAQGEDVVAGIKTPMPIDQLAVWDQYVAEEVFTTVKKLEAFNGDAQDVELTVEKGLTYVLQTRAAKRTARAALRIATEMAASNLIDLDMAVKHVTLAQLFEAAKPVIPASFTGKETLKGIAASGGVATGFAVFSSKEAEQRSAEGVILVTDETNPDDIKGMRAARGIVTRTGGSTAHAAVVARDMNLPCVVGCGDISAITKGSKVTLCGDTGRVWVDIEVPVLAGMSSEVDKFYSMLFTRYGVFETCTNAAEVAAAGDKVLFASYAMEIDGFRGTNFLEVLKAAGNRTMVIDMTLLCLQVNGGGDYDLLQTLEPKILPNSVHVFIKKIEFLIEFAKSHPVKNFWILPHDLLTPPLVAKLSAMGYRVMDVVEDIGSLVSQTGLVWLDYQEGGVKFDPRALTKVLELKQSAAEQLTLFSPARGLPKGKYASVVTVGVSRRQLATSVLSCS
jgi:phosphohistidine swiveling domain-containing protein